MRIIKDNALTLAMLGFFLVFFAGQSVAGWKADNEEREEHGQDRIEWSTYVASGKFWEATAENWESEFLQMAAYVFLSAYLVQRGSAESKQPKDEAEKADEDEDEDEKQLRRASDGHELPWPVRKGGLFLTIYSHSLSLALALLFVGSFVMHAIAGHATKNSDLANHGRPPIGLWEFLCSSRLWFQSLQNWQSEFLSVAVLVVFTIFLRERGSPQSKPVEAPHRATGDS
jgi:hypothetical protein